jgi:hypothetical protein
MDVREAVEEGMEAVHRLTYKVYLKQGYCLPHRDGLLLHYPALDGIKETRVFVAEENGRVVGTNSYTVDGPEHLPEDVDFPNEMKLLRKRCWDCGLEIGSSWRLVVDPEAGQPMRTALLLINKTMEEFVNERDLHLFMFHPKHLSFWQRVLDLDVAERRSARSVNGAAAVLAKGWPTMMKKRWRQICKRRDIPSKV